MLKNKKKPKVAIIHSKYTWYRLPLFYELSNYVYYNVIFLFTQSNKLPIYTKDGKNIGVKIKNNFSFQTKNFKNIKMPSPYPQPIFPGILIDVFKEKYDVIIWGESIVSFEALICFIIIKIYKKRIIFWSDAWFESRKFIRRIISPLINFMFKNADACIAHGMRHESYFKSIGVNPQKIFISGSVSLITPNLNDYDKADKIRRDLCCSEKRIILYVGGLIERKGLQVLIQAFSRLVKSKNDVFLLIVGEGKYKKNLIKLIRELDIENLVHFVGWKKHAALAPYYILCDLFVLPSILYNDEVEPWGLVLNEAMSVGKPVITTNAVGAAYALVKNGINGYIVPQNNVDFLYKKLLKIITNPLTALQMGFRSREIVTKSFTYEKMAKAFVKAIAFTLSQKDKSV